VADTAERITGIGLWDGDADRGAVDLTWDGDRIVSVSTASASAPAADGLSIIPGLIDTHVHLDAAATPGADWMTWGIITPAAERALHIVSHARRAAAAGVTTLRDLGAGDVQFAVARALEAGLVPGPRLIAHGPVGMTAGHGDLFTPPHYPHRPPVADSPDECRKLVRQWARAGADGVKIYTSGGVLSMGDKVGWRNQTDAEIAATVDEASARGTGTR
jgi:imidazolonepropionase-like amidohydrolase